MFALVLQLSPHPADVFTTVPRYVVPSNCSHSSVLQLQTFVQFACVNAVSVGGD